MLINTIKSPVVSMDIHLPQKRIWIGLIKLITISIFIQENNENK